MTENDSQKLDLILKMLEQHDKRFEQMEEVRREDRAELARRFEQVDKRFEQVDKRFDQVIDLIREEKQERVKLEGKVDKVYEAREKVKVTFGWQWGMMSMFIAIIASGITKIFS